MSQITSIAERQNGFAPFAVGAEATFLFSTPSSALELVSGKIIQITDSTVVIDDRNVDNTISRFKVPHRSIVERFL